MSIGRQNGATYFSKPREISARAGSEINRPASRFDPYGRSDLLRRLVAWKPRSGSLYIFATVRVARSNDVAD
jgi:hypothetical protein